MTDLITVEGVAKRYRRTPEGRQRSIRRLDAFLRRQEHWALRDVTFSIAEGESVGLIGINGSGKSTLLRLLSGTTQPTRGRIARRRSVSGLLTLGDSFQAELSAEDNAVTAAMLGGLSRQGARERMPEIAAFAELEAVMDQPIRTYSDGMKLRLAFAVAVSVDPEILLVDEVLAVGDLRFRQKCLDRIELMQERGATLVISSHELEQVEQLCQRAMWLDEGRIRADGAALEVTSLYREAMQAKLQSMTREDSGFTRIGDRRIEITSVRVNDRDATSLEPTLLLGSPVTVEIHYTAHEPVQDPIFGVSVHTPDASVRCLDVTSAHAGVPTGLVQGSGSASLRIERMDLRPGPYRLDVGVFRGDWEHPHDYHWAAYPFSVVGAETAGVLNPPYSWRLET